MPDQNHIEFPTSSYAESSLVQARGEHELLDVALPETAVGVLAQPEVGSDNNIQVGLLPQNQIVDFGLPVPNVFNGSTANSALPLSLQLGRSTEIIPEIATLSEDGLEHFSHEWLVLQDSKGNE